MRLKINSFIFKCKQLWHMYPRQIMLSAIILGILIIGSGVVLTRLLVNHSGSSGVGTSAGNGTAANGNEGSNSAGNGASAGNGSTPSKPGGANSPSKSGAPVGGSAGSQPPPPAVVPLVTLNSKYGSDGQESMDIYAPTNSLVGHAVIVVHGGGWTGGDKSDKDITAAAKVLASNGLAVFNINYRLANKTQPGFPMQNDDLKSAFAWVQQNGANYHADTTKISFLGGSAGGHLVSLTSLQLNNATPGAVYKVASLSGPQDLTVYDGTGNPGIEAYLGCKIASCNPDYVKRASPLYNVTAHCPAFLLVNSDNELTPLSQAQSMQSKLQQSGCQVNLTVLPGSAHAFMYFDGVSTTIIDFFKS